MVESELDFESECKFIEKYKGFPDETVLPITNVSLNFHLFFVFP